MTNNSKLPALLLAGLAIGAAAYYFFGTEEGKKTTDSLAESLKDISESLKDKANETIANVKDKVNSI
ncbi:YtxH domain-containing protein [Pedobacter sp. P351]|uniref:YtxH domain-containing protein n=1 Tax=Pedobacter superstes TaxID=3133441 RepID=UPI0030A6C675